jgi:thioredoxin-dependent peroxiredoxin
LRPGEPVPEFVSRTSTGKELSRADLLRGPAVVYFYPKAGSPGCSLESRDFARLHDRFVAAGVRVVGVSVDPPEAQRKFRDHCELPFDLVADESREVSRRFGVLGRLGVARRTTFLINADGRVLDVIRTWRPGRHASQVLERVLAAGHGLRSVPPATGPAEP